MPETCRVSSRSKFRKMVHLVGFIIKKFVTMHCHTNEKFWQGLTNIRSCLKELFMRNRSVGKLKASLFAFEQVTGYVPSPPSPGRLRLKMSSIQSIRDYFLVVKSKHWPPSSARVQNSWHSTSTPPRSLNTETLCRRVQRNLTIITVISQWWEFF